MQAIRSSETSVCTYRTSMRHNAENHNLFGINLSNLPMQCYAHVTGCGTDKTESILWEQCLLGYVALQSSTSSTMFRSDALFPSSRSKINPGMKAFLEREDGGSAFSWNVDKFLQGYTPSHPTTDCLLFTHLMSRNTYLRFFYKINKEMEINRLVDLGINGGIILNGWRMWGYLFDSAGSG
jgi:hypothetical protein